MYCAILDSCENGLQRMWLDKLTARLEEAGDSVFVRPTTDPLHHVALRRLLADFEAEHPNYDRRVAIIEQDCWPFADWVSRIYELFADPSEPVVVGAQHVWRDFKVEPEVVVSGDLIPGLGADSHVCGRMRPLEGNLAAWFTVTSPPNPRMSTASLSDLTR